MRLLDVVHDEQKLYMVFEYLDMDLKKYMDDYAANNPGAPDGLPLKEVRVSLFYRRRRKKEEKGSQ